jgi:hypothetical protein
VGFFKAVRQFLTGLGDAVADLFGGGHDEPPDRTPPEPGGEGSRGGGIFTQENLHREREPDATDTTFETLLYDRFDLAGWYDHAGDYHDVQNGDAMPPAGDWSGVEAAVMAFSGGMWDGSYRTVTDLRYDDYAEFLDEIGQVLENAYGTTPI